MGGKRIAIVGGGPIGLEAALYAITLGHRVTVFERGVVGQHIGEWGHVRLFSQFSLNHSPLGARTLGQAGIELPDNGDYQYGRDYLARYLEPLARSAALRDTIREETEVLAIGRDRLLKRDLIGGDRQAHPFRLLVRTNGAESAETADIVLDCSGTWRHANALGNGGIPAPGEEAAAALIRYRLDDIRGADRERYEGKRVILVGAGHSAATALDQLRQLDGTTTLWVWSGARPQPYRLLENDPLPERDRLARMGNRIAAGDEPGIEVRDQTMVERIETTCAGTLRVTPPPLPRTPGPRVLGHDGADEAGRHAYRIGQRRLHGPDFRRGGDPGQPRTRVFYPRSEELRKEREFLDPFGTATDPRRVYPDRG